MEQLLLNLLNPQNELRNNSQLTLESAIRENTKQAIQQLLYIISNDQNNQLIELSLLIIHKNILNQSEICLKLDSNDISSISTTLLNIIQQRQNSKAIEKRISEIVIEIAVKSKKSTQMVNFLINQWSQNPQLNSFVLYSFSLLFEFTVQEITVQENQFSSHFLKLKQIFTESFGNQDIQIKILACQAMVMLISNLEPEDILSNFSDLLGNMIQVIIYVIKTQDELNGVKVLSVLDEIMNDHPRVLEKYSDSLLTILNEIIMCAELPSGVRIAAINIIASFAINLSIQAKKSKVFEQQTLIILYQIIMNYSNENLECELNEEEIQLIEGSVQQKTLPSAAIQTINSMNDKLGNKYTLQKFMPFIIEGLGSNQWNTQHTSLLILGVLIEGSKKNFPKDADKIIQLVIPFLKSSNQKVIYSCLTCLALFSDEFAPELQQKYSSLILPSFITLMNSNQNKSLITRTISCLINYFSSLLSSQEEKDQQPSLFLQQYSQYLQGIIEQLVLLFPIAVQSSSFKLIEEMLSLVSILSWYMKDQFLQHYQTFMDFIQKLLHLLNQPNLNYQLKNIKALVLDTVGFLITAQKNNQEILQRDLPYIINFLDNQLQECTDDSPIAKSVICFYKLLCKNMNESFQPHFQKSYDLAFKFSQINVEIHFEEREEVKEPRNQNQQTLEVDLKIFGGKKILSINHNALELKIASISFLCKLVKSNAQLLSQSQQQQLIELIQKNIKELQSSEIKQISIKILKYLLCLYNSSQGSYILNSIQSLLFEYIHKQIQTQNIENLTGFLRLYLDCLKVITQKRKRGFEDPIDSQVEVIPLLSQIIKESLEFSSQLKQKLYKKYKKENFTDPDVQDEFEGEMDEVSVIDQVIMELNGEFLKFRDSDLAFNLISTNLLLPFYSTLIQSPQYVSNSEVLFALCYFADVIEFSSDKLFGDLYVHTIQWSLLMIEKHIEDTDVLQTAIYLLGVIAYRLDEQTDLKIIQSIVTTLYSLFNQQTLQAEEYNLCRENLVSSLFKLFVRHFKKLGNDQEMDQVQETIIGKLPLMGDQEENETINKIIMKLIQEQNQFLIGNQKRQEVVKECLRRNQIVLLKKPRSSQADLTIMDFVENFVK